MTLKKKTFENIEGKGENADNQHFLLFPQRFLLYHKKETVIFAMSNLLSVNAYNLVMSKNLLCCNEFLYDTIPTLNNREKENF